MQYLTLFPVAVLAAGLSLLLTEQATAQARQLVEVKGTVYTDAGEPLPDATVYLDGSGIGGNTGAGGTFSFDIPATAFPAVIKASYIGYETSLDTLRGAGQRLEIFLAPSLTLISDVVVSASRVEENILRAPVTVDKLNAQHLARLST
ncbi:carboxypeptidase-like regulatory domain-containing protein, partial [Hymenobacter guriensis]